MKNISVLFLAICVLVLSLSSVVFAQEEQELLQSAMNSIKNGDILLAQKKSGTGTVYPLEQISYDH